MGVLQSIANIKHRKTKNFSSQPLPVYNQPFHTFSHAGRKKSIISVCKYYEPLVTETLPLSSRWLLTPEWCRALRQKVPAIRKPSVTSGTKPNVASILNDRRVHLP